ncbi:MAG TPA: GntR family transcriptional regulator [Virgibacillus sp.]|nr:GntR family transcriptional regulator [Virgibacillus sp.]HLR67561.1 GntR family transcriptional regulator [Virgibacillus sp.]
MLIHVSANNPKPMYEQIINEFERLIVTGHLQPNQSIPSIRALSRDLTTSSITVRRAYQELEHNGFIYTRAGKGSFVAHLNEEEIMRWKLEQVESPLQNAINQAMRLGLTDTEFQHLVTQLWDHAKNE